MYEVQKQAKNADMLDVLQWSCSDNYLVQHLELFLHEIRGEIDRWRSVLEVPYQNHMHSVSNLKRLGTYMGP